MFDHSLAKATSAIGLKMGKSTKLTASMKKGSKAKVAKHRKVMFESSNTGIATVTAAGKVKAKKKGISFFVHKHYIPVGLI